VRDHINYRKNDRWRSYRFYRALQRLKSPMRYICEIFGAPRFSSFSTQSVRSGRRYELAPVASCVHTRPEAPGAAALELLSRGLLAAIGAWLLFRAIRGEPHRHDACPWDLWRVSYRARLTLFAMVYVLANGVPPAGVAFAAAMLLGVALTPCVVALLTIFVREWRVRS